ncbi:MULTISPECIES: ribbon-helix-helix protein, CopG family [Pseudomonas]|uniref:CopG family ribbon-helix-helix protein n=1 Tax=Pseudomonas TaxID=286 RepID=UPI001781250E|nr:MULTISPECIES: ribbon-helix-helix protein, CopG family [Pseudomonas]MBD8239696.1 ribbon-helix-helix protein, CopG family [Pseudomonas fluorescens]MCM2363868.1 ribbon-helix-helix protein, CopG family [Pseudomonas sp. SR18]MDY0898551.1 ribbon-helix-helix protein, CopG family [Pseudomonas fluorescens]
MAASPVLSFRVKPELANELDQLAKATDRDRQYHLQRALSRYVADESWHFKAVQEGIADAEAGNVTDLDAVKAKWVKRAEDRVKQQSGN